MIQRLTKIRYILPALVLMLVIIPHIVGAADEGFVSLVGLPGIDKPNEIGLQEYLNSILRIAIIIAALIAVVKLVMAGAQYILDGLVTKKEEAKKDIESALVGLLIIIGAVTILRTINPALVSLPLLRDAPSFADLNPVVPPRVDVCTADRDVFDMSVCDQPERQAFTSNCKVVRGGTITLDGNSLSKLRCTVGPSAPSIASSEEDEFLARLTPEQRTEYNEQIKKNEPTSLEVFDKLKAEFGDTILFAAQERVGPEGIRNNPKIRRAISSFCEIAGGRRISQTIAVGTSAAVVHVCWK